MNQQDQAQYDNLKRMINTLEDEMDRITRRDDLRNASRLGSRGEHNWYLFSHLPLNAIEVNMINAYGADVCRIRHLYLIGLYIVTLKPRVEVQEIEEEEEERESEDEVSNADSDSDPDVEETDEVEDIEDIEVKPKNSSDPH
jgi:hypothetical protein